MSDPSMTIVQKLEQIGHEGLTAVEHAAVWLVGKVAVAEESLTTLTASSPLISEALAAGIASAEAHGVPVVQIENAGETVLAAATAFAASLSQPAPSPAPATGS
jgi:hypothetical protein